ncbi:hypothetical protein HDV00_002897 [Rhizophlyctis rosea]|nr:hypothetical protein HDV00_002897 [Rhizophlyctis rosea]
MEVTDQATPAEQDQPFVSVVSIAERVKTGRRQPKTTSATASKSATQPLLAPQQFFRIPSTSAEPPKTKGKPTRQNAKARSAAKSTKQLLQPKKEPRQYTKMPAVKRSRSAKAQSEYCKCSKYQKTDTPTWTIGPPALTLCFDCGVGYMSGGSEPKFEGAAVKGGVGANSGGKGSGGADAKEPVGGDGGREDIEVADTWDVTAELEAQKRLLKRLAKRKTPSQPGSSKSTQLWINLPADHKPRFSKPFSRHVGKLLDLLTTRYPSAESMPTELVTTACKNCPMGFEWGINLQGDTKVKYQETKQAYVGDTTLHKEFVQLLLDLPAVSSPMEIEGPSQLAH